MDTKDGLPIIPFACASEWDGWLEQQHGTSSGLWLKIAKKSSGIDSITYDEALEVAISYGWIDSQGRSFDDQFYLQRFTPRRARSKWSQRNVTIATTLMEQGKMKPAGYQEVDRAKEDGRWDSAYASQSNITVPDDLQAKLDENPAAREFFANLNSANRYAILYRIHDAKKPETRARRIEQYVERLNKQETIY